MFEKWLQPGNVDSFETIATPDQTIVLTASGIYDIQAFSGGSWRGAKYCPGYGGATAPFNTSQLRWSSRHCASVETLHVYVPPEYFREAEDAYRRAGQQVNSSHIDALSLADPLLFSLARSLAVAVEYGAPELHADAAARQFALHILLQSGVLNGQDVQRSLGNDLTDRRLARVVDFMRHNFASEITLDQLAREAGISRFHFVRLFRQRLLVTPHRYLVRLRLQHAKVLLRTTDLDINAVALACGYRHPGRFAAAFHSAFAVPPAQFRSTRR